MTKSYAEYRLKLLASNFPGVRVVSNLTENLGSGVLTKHHEDRDGKFVETDKWKFWLTIEGSLAHTNSSQPFELSITKEELDKLFLDTLLRTCTSVWSTARLNMPEGE
jgi:hypothetical protein